MTRFADTCSKLGLYPVLARLETCSRRMSNLFKMVLNCQFLQAVCLLFTPAADTSFKTLKNQDLLNAFYKKRESGRNQFYELDLMMVQNGLYKVNKCFVVLF